MVAPPTYDRPIYFSDTDMAGVVYFSQLLSICHEAYEAALRSAGFNLRHFFGTAETAVPIIHAEVDFFQPLYCGDILSVKFTAKVLNAGVFELDYQLFKQEVNNPSPFDRDPSTEDLLDRIPLDRDSSAKDQVSRNPSTKNLVAKALTKHSCIDRSQRQKCPIPENLRQCLERWTEPSQ